MNNDMVIRETNIWGNYHNVGGLNKCSIRMMKILELITGKGYPFIDHYKIYTYTPKNQKGPAREEQTFILSYAYNYDSFADEGAFIDTLNDIGLLFHKEKCLYESRDAYKIFIYGNNCPIDVIKQQI